MKPSEILLITAAGECPATHRSASSIENRVQYKLPLYFMLVCNNINIVLTLNNYFIIIITFLVAINF